MLNRTVWTMLGWLCLAGVIALAGCGDDDDDNASGDCSLDCPTGEACEVVDGFPECVQSQQLPGGGGGGGSSQLKCPSLIDCLLACDENDDACMGACTDRSSQETLGITDDYISCVNNCNGTFDECTNGMCSQAHNACVADGGGGGSIDPLTCSELASCASDCDNQQSCLDGCGAESTSEAITLYNNILDCLNMNCAQASDVAACLNQHCGPEVNSCQNHQY